MAENLCKKVGEVGQDNLIAGPYPRASTFGVKLAQNQGVLVRGTVLSLDIESGLYSKLAKGAKANCILADPVDTGSVPETQAQETTLDSRYTKEYADVGISVEGGKIVYKPTGKEPDPKIIHDGMVYVVLQFTPADGAKSVVIRCNGSVLKGSNGKDVIPLEPKNSEDVVDGKPAVYFPIVPVGSTEEVNKTFDMQFTWLKEDGSVAAVTVFAAAKYVGDFVTGVAYNTGKFARNHLVLADGYELTIEDEEELRKGGIILADMMD